MPENTILQIMCPNLTCRRILAVPVNARGKLVRCRGCGSTIRVPEPKAAPDSHAEPSVPANDDQKAA